MPAQGARAQAQRVDVGDQRRPAREQLVGARPRALGERRGGAAAAFAQQRADPLGEAGSRGHARAQRTELEVRVRVDEARGDERVAEVHELGGVAAPAGAQLRRAAQHARDAPVRDPQRSLAQRRSILGDQPAALHEQAAEAPGMLR